jgi:two-component system sensor histidine kinase ArlS
MKIQNKLTIIFSGLFGLILLLFIFGVYHYYSNEVHEGFFNRLHLQAAVKVDLIDGGTVDADVLHVIYENTTIKTEPWVTIYNDDYKLVYRDKNAVLPVNKQKELYNNILKLGQFDTWYGKNQLYGMLIQGEKDFYVAIAMGYDYRGMSQLKTLRMGLTVAYLIAILFIILTVRLFTKQALNPVAKMTKKVSDITEAHLLDIRLDEGNRKDELAHLAITFNNMLSQLNSALQTQKQLVYNISHELRTPLSAIVTELELARDNAQSKEEYEKAIDNVLADSHRLIKLSNDLLDMAKANYGLSEIATHLIRIDEILLEACMREQKNNPKYKVQIIFDKEDITDDRLLSLYGNEYLLGVAFSNLIDNACKFSPDKHCIIHIAFDNSNITIRVEDHGIGIKKEEYESIFKSFYRGDNKTFAEGNGIGLSLTKKIIEIHDGIISVESEPGHTVFTVKLHNIMQDK